MKGLAGGIQRYRHNILIQRYAHRIIRTGLRDHRHTIALLHALYHSLFHDGLDIRRAKELALDGIGLLDPKTAILRDIFLPWQCLGSLEKLLKGDSLKASHLQQNTLRRAQENIRAADSLRISEEGYLSVLHLGNLIAEIQDFFFQDCLQAKMTGCNQFIYFCRHTIPFLT